MVLNFIVRLIILLISGKTNYIIICLFSFIIWVNIMKRDTLIENYKTGRKQKFSNDFYLSYIMRILFYGEK